MRELQDKGKLDTIISEAKKESEQIDESFGGGRSGLPQIKAHVTDSNKPHVKAARILASAKEEDVSTIQKHLISSNPDTFALGTKKYAFKGIL